MRRRQLSQSPTTPSEDQNTMARKPRPIKSRKRLPSSPNLTRKSRANVRNMTKMNAPMKGPIGLVMPPTTAMIRMSIQAPTLTEPGEIVERNGVTLVGLTNVPSTMPYHASQLYARNVSALLQHLAPDGGLALDWDDEITAGACVTGEQVAA